MRTLIFVLLGLSAISQSATAACIANSEQFMVDNFLEQEDRAVIARLDTLKGIVSSLRTRAYIARVALNGTVVCEGVGACYSEDGVALNKAPLTNSDQVEVTIKDSRPDGASFRFLPVGPPAVSGSLCPTHFVVPN